MMNNFLDGWHIFRAKSLHKNVDCGWILYLADWIGSFCHFYVRIDFVCYFDLLLSLLLNSILLEIIIFVVLTICLKYKLLSPVVSGHLLKIIALELLRSTKHLYVGTFLFILFVLFEVSLSRHFVHLNLSFKPRMVIDFSPSYPILWLLDQQFF